MNQFAQGFRLIICFLVLACGAAGIAAASPDINAGAERGAGATQDWFAISNTRHTDLSGSVFASVLWDDGSGLRLVVGGEVAQPGQSGLQHLLSWDGLSWHPLGEPLDGAVRALTVDAAGDLIVAGDFVFAGARAVNHIARWDGGSWHALATGTNGPVYALTTTNSGALLAAGNFTMAGTLAVGHVARWDGGQWDALDGGFNAPVRALLSSTTGEWFAAGDFTQTASALPAARVARWDGGQWQAVGGGVDDRVAALSWDSQGNLIAGGDFTQADGMPALRVARWDGSSWSAMGDGLNRSVFSLVLHQGEVYAGGRFTGSGDSFLVREAARWDGNEWQPVGADFGVIAAVYTLLSPPGGDLIAGRGAGPNAPQQLMRTWDGQSWSPLSGGFNSSALDVLADSSGGFYVSGVMTGAGQNETLFIAHWNGVQWQPLGRGLQGTGFALIQNDQQDLIVGGSFQSARNDDGSINARGVARWDGMQWHAFGAGFNGIVRALAWYNGNLIAAGNFTEADGAPAQNIAQWDGNQWLPLDVGLDNSVSALIVDSNGDLIAGGSFTQSGSTPLNYIARWDGFSWQPLGSGMDDGVAALLLDANGMLIAGGRFTMAGGNAAGGLAAWNGSQWQPLGNPGDSFINRTIDQVSALELDASDNLLVAGRFERVGSVTANNIVRWDGSQWQPLNGGLGNRVFALDQQTDSSLLVAGQFFTAGTSVAPFIAGFGETLATQSTISASNVGFGETVMVTVTVSSEFAPMQGSVSVQGLPAGACSSVDLIPLSATHSQGTCALPDLATGIYTLTARYSGGNEFTQHWQPSVSAPIEVGVGDEQSISFPALPALEFSAGALVPLMATASSGLPVSFSSATPDICTVNGAQMTIQAAGSCILLADQSGNAIYLPAPQVQQTVTINRAMQTISVTNPGTQLLMVGASFQVMASASSGLAVSIESLSPDVCTAAGDEITMLAAGLCQLRFSQSGNSNYLPANAVMLSIQLIDIADILLMDGFESP